MSDISYEKIAALIFDTAQEILVPAGDKIDSLKIEEKGPNDFVTEIDKAMEAALSKKLLGALPGSIVLGEEAAAIDPAMINRLLKTDKPLWIVDPLDGTINFINQKGGYGPIVSLLENGVVKGAWIYDTRDGDPVYHTGMIDALPIGNLERTKPRGFVGGRIKKFLSDMNVDYKRFDVMPESSVSCVSYRELLKGNIDFVLYGMTQPWDHFAGISMIESKGMVALQWDGTPRTFLERNNGLILARTQELAEELLETIIKPVIENAGMPYGDDDAFRYRLA